MKLFGIFVVLAAAKKKVLTPHEKLDKLDRHIDTTWDRWYKVGCAAKRGQKLTNFKNVVDRLRASYDVCGQTAPPAGRRRRDEDGDEGDEDDEDYDYFDFDGGLMDPRLSKNNKDKAAKQLGKIIKKFGADHLWDCTKGVHEAKAAELGKKWTGNLRRMKCAGGYGWD